MKSSVAQLSAIGTLLLMLLGGVSHSAVAQPGSDIIRSRAEVVELNVVVHDKDGRPIPGLQAGDFEVFDEGRRQTVTVFAADSYQRPTVAPLPAGTFTNRLPTTAESGGHAVVLLDWLNTGWISQADARRHVLAMLREITLRDHVALFVLDRGLRVVHDFTSNAEALIARVEGLRGLPLTEDDASPFDASQRGFVGDLFGGVVDRSQVRGLPDVTQQVLAMDNRVRDTLAAFEAIAAHLAGVPGRKSVIWVSAGFPSVIDSTVIRGAAPAERTYGAEIDRTIRELNHADIAVHAVDARGLPVSGRGYVGTLQQFAVRTGGQLFRNRNDLATGMRRGLDDLRFTYRLGYPLPDSRSRFRRVQVRVRRPDVTVRHRAGYFAGTRDEKATAVQALRAPVDAGAVPMTAHAVRQGSEIHLTLVLEGRALDGAGRFDLIARLTTGDGSDAAPSSSQIADVTRSLEKTIEEARRLGSITFTATVEPPPNATRIRVLVRDQQTGAVGTVTIPLASVP